MRLVSLCLAAFLSIGSFYPSVVFAESGILVEISNIRSNKGKIHLLAFARDAHFKTLEIDDVVAYAEAEPQGERTKLFLPELPLGCCALLAFHDENSDEDLNMIAGIPLEGYAFSGMLEDGEQPAFKKAIVSSHQVELPLRYW